MKRTVYEISGDEQQGAKRSPQGREGATADMAGRDAVLPSSEFFDVGRGWAA